MPDPIIPTDAQPAGVAEPGAGAPAVDTNLVEGSQAAAAAAVKAAEAAPAANAEWYAGMPEASHEALKGLSPEDAAAAIERGNRFKTVTSLEDFALDLGKNDEGVDISTLDDGGLGDRYKQHCIDNGIAPEQAQKNLEFQREELATQTAQQIEAGTADLKQRWPGASYQANVDKSAVALVALDAKLGGRLSKSINVKDPLLVEALHAVGEMIGEDNLGAGGPGGGDPNTPITTEEAYARDVFPPKND